MAELGDVATFVRGITFKPEELVALNDSGSVACMRTKNVQTDIDLRDVWAVPASLVKRPEQILRPGDMLVSTANSWNLVGKCCWVPNLPWRSTFGGFISALRPDILKVHPRYLYQWFSSGPIQRSVRGCGRQTTSISNLDIGRCLKLQLPLPSLAQQRRIAAILDQADALRAKRQESIVELGRLIHSQFAHNFARPNESSIPEVTLSALAKKTRTGPFGSQLLHSEFVSAGVAVLGIDNVVHNSFQWGRPRYITERKYDQLRQYQVYPRDVLITIMGSCGRCAIVPPTIPVAINTKHLCCITLDESRCLAEYLQACFLLHPSVLAQLGVREQGAVVPGLNMQIIKELRIPLPPLDRQVQFALFVKAIEKTKSAMLASLAKFDALFSSLQHRAFNGEL